MDQEKSTGRPQLFEDDENNFLLEMVQNFKNYRIWNCCTKFLSTFTNCDNNAIDLEMFQQEPKESAFLSIIY